MKNYLSITLLFSLLLSFSSCMEEPIKAEKESDSSTLSMALSYSKKEVYAARLRSPDVVGNNIKMNFRHSGPAPAGGHRLEIDGLVTVSNVLLENNTFTFRYPTAKKYCFRIKSRFTQFRPRYELYSNEQCTTVQSGVTPPVVVIPVPVEKPVASEILSAKLENDKYIVSFSTNSIAPAGGYRLLVDDVIMVENLTLENNVYTALNIDTKSKHCFVVKSRYNQFEPSIIYFSQPKCLDAKVVAPPVVKPVASQISSLELKDKKYSIKFTTNEIIPAGGYRLLVDDNILLDGFVLSLGQYVVTGIDSTKKHCFKIKSRYNQYDPSQILFSDEKCIDGQASDAVPVVIPVIADKSALRLFNFRILDSNKNRIYFDTTLGLYGNNANGVKLSLKNITSIFVNAGKTTGHYLNVDSSYNYWDNVLINSTGESNLRDSTGALAPQFDLTYIENTIIEPSGNGQAYYVATSGSNNNNGRSQAAAFKTLAKAGQIAKAGDTVHIKAGSYGDDPLVCNNSGTATNPVKYIGYKRTPGDVTSLYYQYGDGALIASELPLIDGINQTGNGITVGCRYAMFKNIQIRRYNLGIKSTAGKNVYENILVMASSERGFDIRGDRDAYNKIINSTVISSYNSNFRLYYHHNLIDGLKSYEDNKPSNPADYYISIRGNHNILRNCHAEKIGNLAHTGHGLSLKGSGFEIEDNLIEFCDVIGIKKSLEARHDEVKRNVYRNINIYRKGTDKGTTGGIAIMNGASGNIFDKITVTDLGFGIIYLSSNEDPTAKDGGHDNIIKNSIFLNNLNAIDSKEDNTGQNRKFYNNKIINSTFHNHDYLVSQGSDDMERNEMINCIISNTKVREARVKGVPTGLTYSSSNFFNNANFPVPNGSGNISVNPQYVDAAKGDLHLKEGSQCIDAGEDQIVVTDDFDGISRPKNNALDIGAYEFKK